VASERLMSSDIEKSYQGCETPHAEAQEDRRIGRRSGSCCVAQIVSIQRDPTEPFSCYFRGNAYSNMGDLDGDVPLFC
jgi:hypothetical protein